MLGMPGKGRFTGPLFVPLHIACTVAWLPLTATFWMSNFKSGKAVFNALSIPMASFAGMGCGSTPPADTASGVRYDSAAFTSFILVIKSRATCSTLIINSFLVLALSWLVLLRYTNKCRKRALIHHYLAI